MQKIPTVFKRDGEKPSLATEEVEPGCEWVLDGEGLATVQWDGIACLVHSSELYRRHAVKEGKLPPPRWFHWSQLIGGVRQPREAVAYPPQNSGHGWLPVYSAPADVHHREAWRLAERALRDGTYELIGPSVQRNPYGLRKHVLVRHGADEVPLPAGRTFEALRNALSVLPHEGIVFWHEDGRMAKIKRRDFGLPWPNGPQGPIAEQGVIPGFVTGRI